METVYRDDLASARSALVMAQIREKRIVPLVQFGGQAQAYWDELVSAWQESLRVREVVIAVEAALAAQLQHPDAVSAAVCAHGLCVQQWIEQPDTRPAANYFSSSVVSQPLIFLTQVANVLRIVDGPGDAQAMLDCASGFLGHSQGVMTALCFAEQRSRAAFQKRVVEIATYLFWQGVRMQQAFPVVAIAEDAAQMSRDAGEGTPSPMAALTGFSVAETEMMLAQANAVLAPHEQIALALVNGWNRVVVSGPPAALCALRAQIAVVMTAWAKDPIRRRTVSWEFIPVSAPFHSPYMHAGLAAFGRDLARLGIAFDAKKIRVPIFHTETGENLQGVRDLTAALLAMQWTQPVRWPTVTRKATQLTGCTHIIDCGPGDPSAKLTALNRRGEGIAIIASATETGRHVLFTDDPSQIPWGDDWKKYRPRVVHVARDAQHATRDVVLDNAFTRFTKFPPIFGAGMTPTSAETDIVAVAANAGYLQEWAGGGQVTMDIWNERLAQLQSQLQPGRGVIFNALYLDPYLWKLHFPKLCAQKDAGFPYLGLTISAGIPDVETATQILQELHRHHIWMNAFKPGNDAQLDQVLKIADANPEFTLLVHVEGGKAGGHHSWEDLHGLMRRNYARLRQRKNLIVCVGGGIATPAQAVQWLWGDWHDDPELPAMPVDAVFLGTRLMACAEAKTSPQVKALLAKISGTTDWVRPHQIAGGVTSQKSPLDADVYFADNAAARAGALLDRLAGKPLAEIQAHTVEIIAALAKTCKPYFGDLTRMTYLQVLERMIELMAPGDIAAHLPHDGVWYDRSFRDRAQMWVERALARMSPVAGRRGPVTATPSEFTAVTGDRRLATGDVLDDPHNFLATLVQDHPALATLRLHPEDVEYFLFLCRQPGKPVNFVPVIDENVRRWYKADSLWQAHDPRYSADAVFTIPGPEAVTGITRADEPIAEIFREFERAIIERASLATASPVAGRQSPVTAVSSECSAVVVTGPRRPATGDALAFYGDSIPAVPMEPATAHVERTTRGARTTFVLKSRAEIIPDAAQWQQWCGAQGGGALAAFLRAGAFAMGQKFIPNLAQQLLIPQLGETWQLERQGDTLSRLITPWCDIVATDDAEIVWTIRHALAGSTDVAELVLPYRWCPDVGHAPIQSDPMVYREALTKFYEKIWPAPSAKKNAALQIGATYRAQTTITRAAIQAYVAATGETAPACTLGVTRDARRATRDVVLQAPPIMSMVAAWEPFATVLMRCGGVANLLDLVHAAHGFSWCADTPIIEGDQLTSELVVTNITPETSGLSVEIAGHVARGKTILVKLTSALFIRGAQMPVARLT